MDHTARLARATLAALASLPVVLGACSSGGDRTESESSSLSIDPGGPIPILPLDYFTYAFGPKTKFADHSTMSGLGLAYGIPDGSLGVIKGSATTTFFGAGAHTCTAATASTPSTCTDQGAYELTSDSFTQLTSKPVLSAEPLLRQGAAYADLGWIFDRDYAGGGEVFPFSTPAEGLTLHGIVDYTYSGYLMPYHGEYQPGGTTNGVPTYYGGIGLAVGDGKTYFNPVGQIIQVQPAEKDVSGRNVGGGYGSMVLADGSGNHLSNPPPAASMSDAYFYVFYADTNLGADGATGQATFCQYSCLAVARASYSAVMAAITPPILETFPPRNPAPNVATLFSKYYNPAGTTNAWAQPGTSGDPTEQTASGTFTSLMDDYPASMASVIWDSYVGMYLMAFMASETVPGSIDTEGICVRGSTDLIHWSPTGTTSSGDANCLAFYPTPTSGTNHTYIYTTLVGDGSDPLTGGPAPVVFFQNFDEWATDAGPSVFPHWAGSELDSIPLNITEHSRFALP